MQGSNTTGVYADSQNNFYNFNYNYDDTSSSISSSVLVNFSQGCTLSPTFSANNTRLILTACNNITLYY